MRFLNFKSFILQCEPDVSVYVTEQYLSSSFCLVQVLQHQVGHEEAREEEEGIDRQSGAEDHVHFPVVVDLKKIIENLNNPSKTRYKLDINIFHCIHHYDLFIKGNLGKYCVHHNYEMCRFGIDNISFKKV